MESEDRSIPSYLRAFSHSSLQEVRVRTICTQFFRYFFCLQTSEFVANYCKKWAKKVHRRGISVGTQVTRMYNTNSMAASVNKISYVSDVLVVRIS